MPNNLIAVQYLTQNNLYILILKLDFTLYCLSNPSSLLKVIQFLFLLNLSYSFYKLLNSVSFFHLDSLILNLIIIGNFVIFVKFTSLYFSSSHLDDFISFIFSETHWKLLCFLFDNSFVSLILRDEVLTFLL